MPILRSFSLFEASKKCKEEALAILLLFEAWPWCGEYKRERLYKKEIHVMNERHNLLTFRFLKKNRCFLLGYLRHLGRKLSSTHLMRWGAHLPRKSLNESITSDDVSKNIIISQLSKEIGLARLPRAKPFTSTISHSAAWAESCRSSYQGIWIKRLAFKEEMKVDLYPCDLWFVCGMIALN